MICQEMPIMTTSVRISMTTLLTTPDSVSLKARWAPMTSLFNRLTSAPVRVRVKKAIGRLWTWSKTAVRNWRIRLSPMLADSQRIRMPRPASTTAMMPMMTASRITVSCESPLTMALTTRPASVGVATAMIAVATLRSRNRSRRRRCGSANAQIRRSVAFEKGRRSRFPCIAYRIEV